MKSNTKTDWFFDKDTKWKESYAELRQYCSAFDLQEDLKWGCPTYTFEGKNVLLIHGFKDYCALLFMKGVLLKDESNLLIQQTENVQAARQMRFTTLAEIKKLKKKIQLFIEDAIQLEKNGTKVELKKTNEFKMPEEFDLVLKEMPELKEAFYKLSPGRQRAYLLYFSLAKQAKTRQDRIEKYVPKILDGKGLDD